MNAIETSARFHPSGEVRPRRQLMPVNSKMTFKTKVSICLRVSLRTIPTISTIIPTILTILNSEDFEDFVCACLDEYVI